MRKCLVCGAIYSQTESSCSTCSAEPESKENIIQYAPELAQSGCGFKAAYFDDLACFEEKHFWFRARRRLIIWALGKYSNNISSFFEIGCGTGYLLSAIANAYPGVKLYGSEIFTTGLTLVSARQATVSLMQIDARNIPFFDEFDSIGAFDVLEHINEDEQVLEQIHDGLKTNGVMILTVPQHAWLWSSVDDYSCHERRYAAKEIHSKVEAAGFRILRSTSFVSFVLPVMLASRIIKKLKPTNDTDAAAELTMPFWLNRLFELIMNIELAFIRVGMDFPMGGSRLVVARKI